MTEYVKSRGPLSKVTSVFTQRLNGSVDSHAIDSPL
jgi:hypothetical protein